MKKLSKMLENILKRKSVRNYTGEQITEEELNLILKAADASPVGLKQYETLHLTVITNKDLLAKIEKEAGAMFGKEDFHPLYGAPTLILISSKQTMPHMANVMYSNAAIMSHNISLAATELNIGSCYIWGATASISDNETIIKELNLPDGFVPCCAVCLGKTNEIFEEREIPNRISKTFIK